MKPHPKLVCLGAFAGAHGVKGASRVKSFTEPSRNIAAYGPVITEDGARQFTLKIVRVLQDGNLIVSAPEIATREDAAALKGTRFYVERDALPEPEEDEFYIEDLVGLKVLDESGKPQGVVKAVHNFGAGDLLEIADIPDVNGVRIIEFSKAIIPVVDIENGRLTVSRSALESDASDDNTDSKGRQT